jgi:hypothetical protein
MEGSLVAYKVFTNGSVLQASEINDNLMNQSVMVFSNSAARSAALTSPIEGMLTWLQDVNRYENYDGTNWVATLSSTLVASTAFSATTAVNLNNIFDATYDNYQIVMSARGTAAVGLTLRLRAAGADLATSTYNFNNVQALDNAISGVNSISGTSWNAVTVRNLSIRNSFQATLLNPAKSGVSKGYFFQAFDWTAASNASAIGGGYNSTTTVFDGFSILCSSGSITGDIQVYGLRK